MGASKEHRQHIRYVNTADGARLAWAESGAGPAVVKAANWLTHLEYEWESPIWKHWLQFFSAHFRFIRYDERGCGMSDWDVKDISLDRRVTDLETVVEAAGLNEPFTLLGISQGASVSLAYAVRHPERVARIVLCGGYARGALKRGDADARRMYEAITDLASLWGSDNPAFRQVFTSRFIPEGTDEQMRWFNELCQKTIAPELAPVLMRARGETDVTALLSQVKTRSRRCPKAASSPPRFQARSSSSSTPAITCCWRTKRPGIAFATRSSSSPANASRSRHRRSRRYRSASEKR
jgi:pimeloyl-ACP methyl ester carboxylesterase